jgi:hypothetical protein
MASLALFGKLLRASVESVHGFQKTEMGKMEWVGEFGYEVLDKAKGKIVHAKKPRGNY